MLIQKSQNDGIGVVNLSPERLFFHRFDSFEFKKYKKYVNRPFR